jgi:hypothetical protein
VHKWRRALEAVGAKFQEETEASGPGARLRQRAMTRATTDRADRLRRSLKRLGYDLVDAERRGRFHIMREGAKVNETADLFGLDLAGVEAWIRTTRRRSAKNTRRGCRSHNAGNTAMFDTSTDLDLVPRPPRLPPRSKGVTYHYTPTRGDMAHGAQRLRPQYSTRNRSDYWRRQPLSLICRVQTTGGRTNREFNVAYDRGDDRAFNQGLFVHCCGERRRRGGASYHAYPEYRESRA